MIYRHSDNKLIHFLHNEMEVPQADIAVALRHHDFDQGPIPMLLWKYGFIDLQQLEKIFDWLAEQTSSITIQQLEVSNQQSATSKNLKPNHNQL